MARALLLYGTGEGHTTDIASEIAATLTEHGHEVDTVRVGHDPGPSPTDYDGVVVGSSIHLGTHDRHLVDWVRHRRDDLVARPAAFFTVCLSAVTEHGEAELAKSYVDGFVEETGWHPDIVGLFGGALLYTRYGFAKRAVVKDIAARQGLPTDTTRDWDLTDHEAVRHFAEDTARRRGLSDVAGAVGAAGPALAWLACGEPHLPTSEEWLAQREAARAAGMRFTKRRTEYLLRRLAGKRAVAGLTGLADDLTALARIELANHAGGAPYALVDGEPTGYEVSLTDRAGWAVCLAGRDLGRVGCDLELVEGRSDGFVADFLTQAERAYVLHRSGVDRDVAANLVWSAKESALKVLGTGLRRDTRTVEVAVVPPDARHREGRDGWGRLELSPAGDDPMAGWWRCDGRFLLTVAATRLLPPPVRLAGSADLADARPLHTWLDRPLAP